MKITVKLFAHLRSHALDGIGNKPFCLSMSPTATIIQVFQALGISENEELLILVNGITSTPDTPLHEGDEVALFPPIMGGKCRKQARKAE